jgi:hypothetical protein
MSCVEGTIDEGLPAIALNVGGLGWGWESHVKNPLLVSELALHLALTVIFNCELVYFFTDISHKYVNWTDFLKVEQVVK